jgi:tRNA (mo5U34)-methyltransferase
MTLHLDVTLTPEQITRLDATDPRIWFTSVEFANAASPAHPQASALLAANNELKQQMVSDWIARLCPGAAVLDTCCANGAFSFEAAKAGATDVTGFDFEQDRIDAANLVADLVAEAGTSLPVHFEQLDAYEVGRHYAGRTFDVTLCLGSLYHLADPPYILRQLRSVTSGWLILQSSGIRPEEGNHASFQVRGDRTAEGLSSVRGGNGVWTYTVDCLKEIVAHGGFEIVEERRPDADLQERHPWYTALARTV